jgi:hypothetical protein
MDTWANVPHYELQSLFWFKEFVDQINLLYIWICLYLQQIKSYEHVS